jgi:hypothetical protein
MPLPAAAPSLRACRAAPRAAPLRAAGARRRAARGRGGAAGRFCAAQLHGDQPVGHRVDRRRPAAVASLVPLRRHVGQRRKPRRHKGARARPGRRAPCGTNRWAPGYSRPAPAVCRPGLLLAPLQQPPSSRRPGLQRAAPSPPAPLLRDKPPPARPPGHRRRRPTPRRLAAAAQGDSLASYNVQQPDGSTCASGLAPINNVWQSVNYGTGATSPFNVPSFTPWTAAAQFTFAGQVRPARCRSCGRRAPPPGQHRAGGAESARSRHALGERSLRCSGGSEAKCAPVGRALRCRRSGGPAPPRCSQGHQPLSGIQPLPCSPSPPPVPHQPRASARPEPMRRVSLATPPRRHTARPLHGLNLGLAPLSLPGGRGHPPLCSPGRPRLTDADPRPSCAPPHRARLRCPAP